MDVPNWTASRRLRIDRPGVLGVVTWLWGDRFDYVYVNRLASMLRRHLHLPHKLHCVTDTPAGIDPDITIVQPPARYADTPRCRRRMWQWSRERFADFGPRMLAIDLDVVLVDDITPIVDRPESIVCWRVGYANVLSGSFLLADTGALDGAWRAYEGNPDGFPKETGERNASDQAMLNHYIKSRRVRVAEWTERDGFVTWFGKGYENRERHGMGPTRNGLLPGARIVVLGSSDKHVLDEGRYSFVRTHWQ